MKSIIIKGLELPTGDGNFIDIRIQSDGKALLVCGMGQCAVYDAEEVETSEDK